MLALAGDNGFYSNCWCAWWLVPGKEWDDIGALPIDTAASKKAAADLYTGVLSTFESVGFVEIARRGGRPIVRREL